MRDVLRLITCGSVDDGKSTVIGRLLYDANAILADQLQSLIEDSKRYGTQGDNLDFALLTDGLLAEREQGITIDVAYRYFSSPVRNFIIADTPGHEQYTRNMATGASTADLAIILMDATKGIVPQTERHSRIVAMMGIKQVVLAINKMDLIEFNQAWFTRLTNEYQTLANQLGFSHVQAVPLCAIDGDNIVFPSDRMAWYPGPTLLDHLNTIQVRSNLAEQSVRLPIQTVLRPDSSFRGYATTVASGQLRVGDVLTALPARTQATVAKIYCGFEQVLSATSGQAIAITLENEIDVSRGDVLISNAESTNPQTANASAQVADQFEARLLWMTSTPLLAGRSYFFKIHNAEVSATICKIKYCVDLSTGAHLAAKELALNDLACVQITLNRPVVFTPFSENVTLGSFILIDKLSFETVAAGTIDFALRRASNIHWQALEVTSQNRALIKNQTPKCFWFTGLSGSGKSTIASAFDSALLRSGKHTYVLDGDNIRHGLNRDLGFTDTDRIENIRRVAEVARLMVDAGLIVIVSFISPFAADRKLARSLFKEGEFIEVFVDAPLEECERRDVKGLYAKARRGELPHFTGIDSPFEAPTNAEVYLDTASHSTEQCVAQLLVKIDT
jgi:bifunctional enzyme CysN/CysC